MTTNRDYYKVLLVSQSGKGKTYSFRNMNQDTTGFINVENKPLPFKNNFKYHARPKKYAGVLKALEDYASNPDIEVIVIDSLSAVFEILIKEMRDNYSGWDVWGNYNKLIGEFLERIKNVQKEIFLTAHYEILNSEGEPEKRVKVKGKEHEGTIEKEFTMVLYADSKFTRGVPEYNFRLAQEGTSAKCPPEIFGPDIYSVPNDSKMVFDKIKEFTREEKRIAVKEAV
jgi:hypothetical protein